MRNSIIIIDEQSGYYIDLYKNVLTTNFKEQCPDCGGCDQCYPDCDADLSDSEVFEETKQRTAFNNMMNGIESLLLTLHCEGVDINTDKFKTAIKTAIEACANHS